MLKEIETDDEKYKLEEMENLMEVAGHDIIFFIFNNIYFKK